MPSLISISDLKDEEVREIVDLALELSRPLVNLSGEAVSLIFLEASTRTRVSFECAIQALGGHPVVIQEAGSSFEKEETLRDTLLNLRSMGIRAHVIRTSSEKDLLELKSLSGVSIINGGDGKREHPTQALLDLTTIRSFHPSWDDLRGKVLAIVGDLRSSRVARSWAALAPKVGLKLRWVAPKAWQPVGWGDDFEKFDTLNAGTDGAQYVMALRVQKERHGTKEAAGYKNFVKGFQLNTKNLPKNAKLLHPGPVNWGTELASDLQNDPRSLILLQVKYGVSLRKVVLSRLFESYPPRIN